MPERPRASGLSVQRVQQAGGHSLPMSLLNPNCNASYSELRRIAAPATRSSGESMQVNFTQAADPAGARLVARIVEQEHLEGSGRLLVRYDRRSQ